MKKERKNLKMKRKRKGEGVDNKTELHANSCILLCVCTLIRALKL
jgi:hypothetical protein